MLKEYTVHVRGIVNFVGTLNMHMGIIIRACGEAYAKAYAGVGIHAPCPKIIEELITKPVGKPRVYFVQSYGVVAIFENGRLNGRLCIDMRSIPINHRLAWFYIFTNLLGIIIYHRLNMESVYWILPSKSLVECKVPKEIEIPEEYTYYDLLRATAGLHVHCMVGLTLAKCITCALGYESYRTVDACNLSEDELTELSTRLDKVYSDCLREITRAVSVVLKR